MTYQLLTPKAVLGHVVVLSIVSAFVSLGVWQLGRLDERRDANSVTALRVAAAPESLESLLASTGQNLEAIEDRIVFVEGEFQPSEEVLLRSRVWKGQPGFHLLVPLVSEKLAVLVNRGWIPIDMDTPPVAVDTPEGRVRIEGLVRLSQIAGPAREDPAEGTLSKVNRVDLKRLSDQLPTPLAPVYIELISPERSGLPMPHDPPDASDEGPHLAYALQWFAFALIGILGYAALLRTQRRRRP